MSNTNHPTEEEPEEKPVLDRFPFFMMLVTMFVNGALFCILRGPALYLWIQGRHFRTTMDIYRHGILPIFAKVFRANIGILPVSVTVVACLLIGLLLSPIDRLVAVAWTSTMNLARRKHVYYSALEVRHPDYIRLLSALVAYKPFKLYWEWELLQMHLSWHVVTNLTLYTCIEVSIFNGPVGLGTFAPNALVYFMFLMPALLRSEFMCRVHRHYMEWLRVKQ